MGEKFTVIFYDEDRKTILEEQEVEQGQAVKFQGKLPEKGIGFAFAKWETTGNMDCVEENMEVFACYEETSKMASQPENNLFDLVEKNAESANLNEVMQAGQKVLKAEQKTRELTEEQRVDLVNEILQKGSVDLENSNENARD